MVREIRPNHEILDFLNFKRREPPQYDVIIGKNWGVNFLPQIPPIGTPGILKFKNGEKMKHPINYAN